jgi:ubiquinone/menaquinone biosynthesis C-methylase UbiE
MAGRPRDSVANQRKETIVESWDARAEQWDRWTPVVDSWFGPATELMLQYLRLQPGESVLELAAGTGGFTKHLSAGVGPTGRVVATDSGPAMVQRAARNALQAGLANVSARVMDAEHPDVEAGSADAIACRQAFMLLADPEGALRRLRRVLRPGGRVSLSVFSTPENNGILSVPGKILARWANPNADPPLPVSGPGPFRLGAPGLLERYLNEAGYSDIVARAVVCPLLMPSLEELLRFYHELLDLTVKDLSAEDRTRAWGEVEEAVSSYTGEGSAGAPCEILVVAAHRPVVRARRRTPPKARPGLEPR